ncbi:GMC family oxidoreductase [Pseudonocardia alaniniphila]|uniref:GMC family oxidoreductase N-terminal domain-containing protein n=1 Tax=Pseudonocardia alaniniphila TaxID=75291 RepID=A0ABS9T8J4_9PSEU|nr:GMC family oxidoreductase N-terminal domain-containing protein [Pseudonocardia alaniniphila]MCH6164616.1 GMC family oxidoreductase N-terminal domain-containing protein [Pseudonocardia alaniniphila]
MSDQEHRLEADFVVVGAGTAGCVIAARLSENPDNRVVLLEAGPVDGPEMMAIPSAFAALSGTTVDWAFRSEPQSALDGAVLAYPRGRVLGGSSSINAMAHIRAHRSSYDDWVRAGASGWGYDDLLPYFRRSERTDGPNSRWRGVDGPMQVAVSAQTGPFTLALRDAVVGAGIPFSNDLNGPDAEGAGWLERNIVDGVRQSAADAYIRPVLADRPNLTVIAGALARRLLVSGERCRGVEYSAGRQMYRVEAGREVIVSAGAIGSPHLLLLSGIGPEADLRGHRIPVVVDLPGVGDNLQDHAIADVVYSATKPLVHDGDVERSLTVMMRSDADIGYPDVQLLCWTFPSCPPTVRPPELGYTLGVVVGRPRSRGRIRLASDQADTPPLIDPRFLSDPHDVQVLLTGLRRAREIGSAAELDEWRDTEFRPGPDVREPEQWQEYLCDDTHSARHPAGTCRIGDDDGAVVDTVLRVRGISGLRVADASVMPSMVGANINATVLAIAERAAELIGSAAG